MRRKEGRCSRGRFGGVGSSTTDLMDGTLKLYLQYRNLLFSRLKVMSTTRARNIILTGAVAAITATGAWYGAGLKTRQEISQVRYSTSPYSTPQIVFEITSITLQHFSTSHTDSFAADPPIHPRNPSLRQNLPTGTHAREICQAESRTPGED